MPPKADEKTYCVTCKEPTKTVKGVMSRTSNGRMMMKGTCAECGKKKASFVKGAAKAKKDD